MQRYVSFDIGEKNFAYFVVVIKNDCITAEKLNTINIYEKKQTIIGSCIKISHHLETEEVFKQCDVVLIEQQMLKNIRAQRLSQHVWSWFFSKYPTKQLFVVPASLKTQHFLGKNQLSPKQRKVWSIKYVEDMFKNVNHAVPNGMFYLWLPPSIQESFARLKKKDDASDTILQLLAYLNNNVKHI